jgi:hypothetical protein
MANFAILGGAAFAVGLERYTSAAPFTERPKGLLNLVGVQMAFLLTHALIGWCPPVAIFRRLGFRTKSEIDTERELLVRALEDFEPPDRRAA